jgi:hypothetical protein
MPPTPIGSINSKWASRRPRKSPENVSSGRNAFGRVRLITVGELSDMEPAEWENDPTAAP